MHGTPQVHACGGGSLVQLKELPVMFQSLIGRMEKRIIADFLLFDE